MWEQIVSFCKKYKVFILAALGIIALMLLTMALWSAGSNYFFNRDIEKKKANVNAALNEANRIQANVDIDKSTANQIAENVNIASHEYLDAINATDRQRAETNAAIANMQKAANTNRNVNASELEKILEGVK